MKITIVGSGYVGLVTGACFSEVGIDVKCVDVDQQKIDKITEDTHKYHDWFKSHKDGKGWIVME